MSRIIQLSIGGIIIVAILIGVAYQGVESTVFFYTPTEILAAPADFKGKLVRIGAMVQPRSTRWDEQALRLEFRVTEDAQHFIPVVYQGVKPDLYREGQGVVVEGRMRKDGTFEAHTLLVKHSEEYRVGEQEEGKVRLYESLLLPPS